MYYANRDITLYYEIHGQGRPILMLHGFTPDHRLMKGCMEPILADYEDYQRIYLDLPGMGQSSSSQWIQNADDMLELLFDSIQDTIQDTPFILCGESYGGYLARGILSHFKKQVLGLFLICPVIKANSKDRILPPHRIILEDQVLKETLDQRVYDEFSEMSVLQSPSIFRRYKEEILCGVEMAHYDFLENYQKNGYGFSFDVDKRIGVFDQPTLILVGRQDSIVGYQDALALIEKYPRSSLAILDGAGHNLQIEQSTLFNNLTKEWLQRIGGSYEPF